MGEGWGELEGVNEGGREGGGSEERMEGGTYIGTQGFPRRSPN